MLPGLARAWVAVKQRPLVNIEALNFAVRYLLYSSSVTLGIARATWRQITNSEMFFFLALT